MAIGNHNDLTHIVRTSDQWKNTYDKYELIPTGVLCVELVSSDVTKIKIGDGHNIFSKLPYIGDLDLSKYYTKLETDTRIKEILTQEKVVRIKGIIGSKSDLPADARCGDIYFVRQLSSSDNKYIEYIYSPDNTWEPLGGIPVDIDLSEYAKTAYVDDKIEQVNERIDDIEQHGTHTHANKDILDLITAAFTAEEKDKLSTLYNYDDTELRELITQASHTHSNKDILDAISAAFTAEDRVKLDSLTPYDDTILKEKITALERLAHEHSNKRILDRTTASFTTEYERKMRWIRIYTGCTGMEEGIAGLVPAAQAGEEDYVLSGSGEWVPQTGGGGTYELPIATTSTLGGIKVGDGLEIDANGKLSVVGGGGGGDSIAEGDGITITTDPQTGVKTISVDTGNGLQINQDGELEIDPSIIPDVIEYNAGEAIDISPSGTDLPSGYADISYIESTGSQWTQLDYYANNNSRAVVDYVVPNTISTTNGAAIFGSGAGSDKAFVFWDDQLTNNQKGGFVYGSNSWSSPTDANSGRNFNKNRGEHAILDCSVNGCFIDNNLLHGVTPTGNFSSTIALGIFASATGDQRYSYGIAPFRIYSFKIYENDVLVVDLRPALRLSDNKPGFYDVINDDFYPSLTSTEFAYDSSSIDTHDDIFINVKYNKGLTVNSNNELEVNIGTGLEFDQTTGAINVTGGGGGDTVEAGDGIDIDTDSQTGNKVISIDTGNGLQINQDGELEIDPSIIPDVPQYYPGKAIDITASADSNLPAGYAEVDYIEAPGDSYTIIDYIPNRNTKIIGTAMMVDTSTDPVVFGARTGGSGQQFVFWFNRYSSTQATVGFVYGTNTWDTTSDCGGGKLIPYVVGDQFTFLLSLEDEFNVNGEFVHNITENGAPASDIKLGIFALTRTNTSIESSDTIFKGRMYEFKIYENDELVVNLVPAIHISTGSVGFYDTIGDTFYTSRTSTPFVCDPSTAHVSGYLVDVKYDNGLTVNSNNELEVVLSKGLEFDPNATETMVADEMYLFASNVSCQVHTDNPVYSTPANRTYQKTTTEPALCCLWEVGDSGYLWTGPLIVGLTPTSVQYTTQDTQQTVNYQNTFTYLDKTWYTSGYPDFLNNADHEDKLGNLQYLGSYAAVTDQIQAAKDLIDLANVQFVSNAGIQAKLGNGLQFDANGAIEAVGGGESYEAGNGIEIAEVTHEDEFRVQNQEYFFTDHGLTCIITGNYGPRTFTKINDGDIVAAVIGTTGGWYMPLFVGLTEDSVKYSNSYDSNILGPDGSFTYHDKTWYYTANYALTAGDGVDHAGHLQSMTDTIYDGTEGKIQAAKDLIDLAVLLPDVSTPTISAKIGAGLSFDANGAIQADAQPLSPATDSTLGGVIVGDGILVDNDGTISVDPTIIPEVTEYEAGTAISIEDVEHGGVIFDAWDSGTGWENVCYSNSTGDSVVSYPYEAHSPISNSYTLPAGATKIRAISYDQNDTMLWTSFSWIDSNNYHFASTSPEDGYYDDWFDIPTGAVKVNFGVRHSKLNTTTAMSLNDIKSVDITVQTVSEIEVDVWNGGTGWLNGNYYSGNDPTFTTNWYYSYHSNPDAYIPIPNGATHVMVMGISNENDSHFEGGGVNVFSTESHSNHIYWWGCAWEWHEISSDAKFVQIDVKWNDNNTRTIAGSDIKSVTLVWKLPTLEVNQGINVKYGDGLTVNQNNELEVNLGSGLQFDANGAIEVTGGSGGGDTIAEGDGITITTDSQTGIKTIGINVGNGLDIDPITNELFVDGQLPEGTIIKKLTYVGDGSTTNSNIHFSKKPLSILSLNGSVGQNYGSVISTPIDAPYLHGVWGGSSGSGTAFRSPMSYDNTTNTLSIQNTSDVGLAFNISGKTYTMYYLTKGHTGSGTSVNNEVSVIKTISYTGTGASTNNIQLPETPDYILGINGRDGASGDMVVFSFDPNHTTPAHQYIYTFCYNSGIDSGYFAGGHGEFTFNSSTNILTLTGGDQGAACNYLDRLYYLRYVVNEVIPSQIAYAEGEAISIETVGGLQLTDYSNDDFVTSITSINAGTIVKAADNSSFTLTATSDDCYTRGSSMQSNGSYPYNVKSSTKYRFTWDSADPDKYGTIYVFENGQYGDMMHSVNQHDASYIEFTTTAQTSYIQARFGVDSAGNSITYSNVRLYEVIEEEDQYDEISVKYNKGLSVNQNNELEVNIGTGLAFDPQTGAINVTGGGGGSGDTVAEGDGISITTDQQTGDKVIAVNPGAGLQVNQTTNELEVSSGVVTSIAPTQNTPGSITVTEGDGTTTPVSVISQMGGATSSTAGTAGYVPAPSSGDDDAYLRGDGTWDDSVLTDDDELTLVFVPDDYQPS